MRLKYILLKLYWTAGLEFCEPCTLGSCLGASSILTYVYKYGRGGGSARCFLYFEFEKVFCSLATAVIAILLKYLVGKESRYIS